MSSVHRPASTIVDSAYVQHANPDLPEGSRPKKSNLVRTCNRVRQKLRQEDPYNLDFEVSEFYYIEKKENRNKLKLTRVPVLKKGEYDINRKETTNKHAILSYQSETINSYAPLCTKRQLISISYCHTKVRQSTAMLHYAQRDNS